MGAKFAELHHIDQDLPISREENYEAWYHLEQGLLLALKESGVLHPMQYRLAEEGLKQQRRARSRRLREEGEK